MEDYRHAPEAPPAAPRELTPEVLAASASHGRFLRTFGMIWMVVGGALSLTFAALAMRYHAVSPPALGLSFALVGILTYLIGRHQHRAALELYRGGAEAEGEVLAVYVDRRVKLMGKSPWRVKYEYLADEQRTHGTASFWDGIKPQLEEGDTVAVLYRKEAPSKSVLWMTVEPSHGKPEKEEPRARKRRKRRRAAAAEAPRVGVDDAAAVQQREGQAQTEAQGAATVVARERS